MFVLCINPHLIREYLAHRAASVTAGIIMDLHMTALAASGYINTVCPCLTIQDMDILGGHGRY